MNLAKKLWMTTGDSSGGGPAPSGGYVDDVFSTYLYAGNGSTQTINNGIDLAGEGGLVWIKGRSNPTDHALYDTARGATLDLVSNSTAGQTTQSAGLTTFGNSGFSVGSLAKLNTNSSNYTSWTFRKAPKFFDVVTYTGNGVTGRQIAHSLGVQVGFVTVKSTSTTGDWNSYHLSTTGDLKLNLTDAQTASRAIITAADASTFTVNGVANTSGVTYVAYLWAHDTSTDGIIQCGSFTTLVSGDSGEITLGWEPQYLLTKPATVAGGWRVTDVMRGWADTSRLLYPNYTDVEVNSASAIPRPNGFKVVGTQGNGTHIYLAIRRSNKPPTTGTQVYNAIARTGTGAAATVTGVGFAPDFTISKTRGVVTSYGFWDRLRGALNRLSSDSTSAETQGAGSSLAGFDSMNGIILRSDPDSTINAASTTYINHFFRRAPGFFDVVCDTDTGVAHAITHNLTKAPELIIRKSRSVATQWEVWHSALAATEKLVLNSDAAKVADASSWNSTLPTATQFTVGTGANTNANTRTSVTYLFATLPGISKVGSYSGNGGTQTIPCGFTTGSRFILIKRIDNTGDWFVWDTARGITPTTDPHLSLNTVAAEVTTDDSIDQDASGFVVNQNAATNINALGGNYLFLAIA